MPNQPRPVRTPVDTASGSLSEQDLRDFVESANVGMQSVAADGTILWANRAQYAPLGFEREEYVGRHVADFHADRTTVDDVFEGLARGDQLRDVPAQMLCKDGALRNVLMSSTGVWQDGRLIRSRCVTLDAADRARAAETQALLAAIVTASADAIISKSLDGVIRTWNGGAERLFGYTAAEAIDRHIELIVPPELHDEERLILARLRRGERIEHFETVRVTKSGRRVNISLAISPIFESGRIIGASKVARDITDRLAADRALHESEGRYRAIVESQAELVCRFRPDGTILFANGAYARSVGASPEALVGADLWSFVTPEDQAAVRGQLASLTPASPEVKIENRFQTAGGERWTLWTNRALTFDASGQVLEAQSTGIDITDRKRAEEALREADRRKNEFLATLGHELRNPLAPIRNMLEVLERADEDPTLRQRARATMSRQLDVIVRLVDDLLDVARITRGQLQLRTATVDLATVVREAIEDVQYLIDEARHELVLRLPEQPVLLVADPVRLAQTFTNLLSNAAKYTPDGGRIELAAERDGHGVRIAVRDNGLGIPAAQLDAIFEMFEQVDHSLERGYKGLGIGLSLVQSLVRLHGGHVEARSAGLGQGSEFIVWLPVAEPPAPSRDEALGADATAAPISPRRVLVVDDNRDAAGSLAMLLDMLGHESRVAFDGEEALLAAEEFRPHVVLLDIGLPKRNGHDVARELRARAWSAATVIVAVTGWGQESDREASRAAGCDAHATKPLTLDKLQEALHTSR